MSVVKKITYLKEPPLHCVGALWVYLRNCNLEKMQHVTKKWNLKIANKKQVQKDNANNMEIINAPKMQVQTAMQNT